MADFRPMKENQRLYERYSRGPHGRLLDRTYYYTDPKTGRPLGGAVPTDEIRKVGTLDAPSFTTEEEAEAVAEQIRSLSGFDNVTVVPSPIGGWNVAWGDQEIIPQLHDYFRRGQNNDESGDEAHRWLGRNFGLPDEMIEEHVQKLQSREDRVQKPQEPKPPSEEKRLRRGRKMIGPGRDELNDTVPEIADALAEAYSSGNWGTADEIIHTALVKLDLPVHVQRILNFLDSIQEHLYTVAGEAAYQNAGGYPDVPEDDYGALEDAVIEAEGELLQDAGFVHDVMRDFVVSRFGQRFAPPGANQMNENRAYWQQQSDEYYQRTGGSQEQSDRFQEEFARNYRPPEEKRLRTKYKTLRRYYS